MRHRPLCQPLEIELPRLDASLDGLTIAHLTDLHICRWRSRWRRLIDEMARQTFDLILLTGDQMHHPGDESIACDVLGELLPVMQSRLGIFGVFGNHDTLKGRRQMRQLPHVRWLEDRGVRLADGRIQLWGQKTDKCVDPDSLSLLANLQADGLSENAWSANRPLTLLMTHYPMELPTAADLGVDLMFSGHTHGGQWRLPWGRSRQPFYNSSDLPMRLTCGLLSHRRTLAAVSRGLGESSIQLRFFCDPHVPVYRLRPGSLSAAPVAQGHDIRNIRPF